MCWWQAFICNGLSKLQLLNEGTGSLPLGLRVSAPRLCWHLAFYFARPRKMLREPTRAFWCVRDTARNFWQITQYVHESAGWLASRCHWEFTFRFPWPRWSPGSRVLGAWEDMRSSSEGPATCTEVHIRAAIVRWAGLLEFQPVIPEIWGKKNCSIESLRLIYRPLVADCSSRQGVQFDIMDLSLD